MFVHKKKKKKKEYKNKTKKQQTTTTWSRALISEAVESKITFNLGLSLKNIVATKGHKTVSAKLYR